MARADNSIRQLSTLQSLELGELNRILRKIQGDVAALQGYKGPIEQRDALNLLAPPVNPTVADKDSSNIFFNPQTSNLCVSEDGNSYADMLNACGIWRSQQTAATPADLVWDEEIVGDERFFHWDGSTNFYVKGKGTFLLIYRLSAVPNGGSLRVNLVRDGSQVARSAFGGAGTLLPVMDQYPFKKVTDEQTVFHLDSTVGTSIGSTGVLSSYLTLLKIR